MKPNKTFVVITGGTSGIGFELAKLFAKDGYNRRIRQPDWKVWLSLIYYPGQVHTQSAIEALLDLRESGAIETEAIEQISLRTFLTAYHIVGGGEYGDRREVYTKEQADHSLPYILAVAWLDGTVMPEQLLPERINRDDVQQLLKKVKVHTSLPIHKPVKVVRILDTYTAAYPEKIPAKIEITCTGNKTFAKEAEDYHGFFTRYFTWEDTVNKFRSLTKDLITAKRHEEIIESVYDLENKRIKKLLPLIL